MCSERSLIGGWLEWQITATPSGLSEREIPMIYRDVHTGESVVSCNHWGCKNMHRMPKYDMNNIQAHLDVVWGLGWWVQNYSPYKIFCPEHATPHINSLLDQLAGKWHLIESPEGVAVNTSDPQTPCDTRITLWNRARRDERIDLIFDYLDSTN